MMESFSLSADSAVLDLCALLFREPQRLLKAHAFPVVQPRHRQADPHLHHNILQFDLAVGCCARRIVDGSNYGVRGETLAIFYPHQMHGYEVLTARENSRVLSLKFYVETDWPAVQQRVFAALHPALTNSEALIHAWDRLIRYSTWSARHPFSPKEYSPARPAHLLSGTIRHG